MKEATVPASGTGVMTPTSRVKSRFDVSHAAGKPPCLGAPSSSSADEEITAGSEEEKRQWQGRLFGVCTSGRSGEAFGCHQFPTLLG